MGLYASYYTRVLLQPLKIIFSFSCYTELSKVPRKDKSERTKHMLLLTFQYYSCSISFEISVTTNHDILLKSLRKPIKTVGKNYTITFISQPN